MDDQLGVQQMSLLPAGCQPWNNNMIAARNHRFAYCASLAVYFYELDEKTHDYRLTSISSTHQKTISCISWGKVHHTTIATASGDQEIHVLDIDTNTILYSKTCQKPITCIDWLPGIENTGTIAYCHSDGPIILWHTKTNKEINFSGTSTFDMTISLFKWHHTDASKFVVGHHNGSLSFYFSGKVKKHAMTSGLVGKEERDEVQCIQWDPLSNDYFLVSRHVSGIQLIDSNSRTIVMTFVFPGKNSYTNTLSWVDSAPGMFLTGDAESGVLRMWSAGVSHPIKSFNIKDTGFNCLYALRSKRNNRQELVISDHKLEPSPSKNNSKSMPDSFVFCAFKDGGVGLYDLHLNKWQILKEQGHMETIFDCKFNPRDPYKLATASFDGTLKVWDTSDLSCIESSPGNEGIIYTLCWSPNVTKDVNLIAAGTRRKGIFVWDMKTLKVLRRYKEHGLNSVFCIDWIYCDKQHRIASCGDDGKCYVRDFEGKLLKKYPHPDMCYGCEWNRNDQSLLATGCADGSVRIYNLSLDGDSAQIVLKGHLERVFHVRWHPSIKNILCSGSDDTTVKIWNVDTKLCTLTLEGHVANVRGLCWNPEISFLLTSGCWDGNLKLWDVRDGTCYKTIQGHQADVYGLNCHPMAPFTVASSSRDSTVKIWSFSKLVQGITTRLLFSQTPIDDIVGEAAASMEYDSVDKLSGKFALQIKNELKSSVTTKTHCDVIKSFASLIYSNKHVDTLFDIVSHLRGLQLNELSANYGRGKVVHMDHLLKYKIAKVKAAELRHSRAQGKLVKDKLTREIAGEQCLLGDMRGHCMSLVQLGQWLPALALAPSVSMQFWSELTKMYSDKLFKEKDHTVLPYLIANNQPEQAVRHLLSRNNPQAALVVAQSSFEGCLPRPNVTVDENNSEDEKKTGKEDNNSKNLVDECITKEAKLLVQTGDIYQAACLYLSNNNILDALIVLFNANELVLVLLIATSLKFEHKLVKRAAYMYALHLAKKSEVKPAVNVMQIYEQHSDKYWAFTHQVCSEVNHSVNQVRQMLSQQPSKVFRSPAAAKQALEIEKRIKNNEATNDDLFEHVQLCYLSNNPENGLEWAVKILKDKLSDREWSVDEFIGKNKILLNPPSVLFNDENNKKNTNKILATSYFIGALKAAVWNYGVIVKPLLECSNQLACSKTEEFPISKEHVSEQIKLMEKSLDEFKTAAKLKAKEADSLQFMKEPICLVGEITPSNFQNVKSTVTDLKITGSYIFLEDDVTVMSTVEAMMWIRCCPYSPTCTGHLMASV